MVAGISPRVSHTLSTALSTGWGVTPPNTG